MSLWCLNFRAVNHSAAVKYVAVSGEGGWTERYNLKNKVLISQ